RRGLSSGVDRRRITAAISDPEAGGRAGRTARGAGAGALRDALREAGHRRDDLGDDGGRSDSDPRCTALSAIFGGDDGDGGGRSRRRTGADAVTAGAALPAALL